MASTPRVAALALLVSATGLMLASGGRAQQAEGGAETPAEPEHEVRDAAVSAAVAPPATIVQALDADASTPVAIGRGVLVTSGDLVRRVNDAPEPTRAAWAAHPDEVETVLDRMVADRLLVNEARRLGLDHDPAVRAAVERALIARLRATVVNPAAGDGTQITADEIRAFYDAHPTRFHIPEHRAARVVFVTHRRDAERILVLARAQRRHRAVNDFIDLAARYNTDAELARLQGELREIEPQQIDLDAHLVSAIYAIDAPGHVFETVVRGSWHGTPGFFVVKLTGRRAAIDRTLAESADWIRQRLVLEHRVETERLLVERLAREAALTRTPASQVVRVVPMGDAGMVAGP